ncbi:MAG TPA: hypothetical protein VLA53_01935 [Nitrosopumilaceae archaeon]|nr:hypothetical protein [Nitrosopumilaceae archaeon]
MKFFIYFLVFFAISFGYAYGYEEISTSNFKVVNTLGEEIKSPLVEQQLNLQTSLTNVSDRELDWAYIVQIIDSKGAIVDLNFSTGSLVQNQTLATALFWTPHNGGTYKIETFVWNNLRDISALSPKSTYVITVT